MARPKGGEGVERRWLSVPEIVALTGLHRDAVLREIKAGRLPGRKVGHTWRVAIVEFEAFMADTTAPS